MAEFITGNPEGNRTLCGNVDLFEYTLKIVNSSALTTPTSFPGDFRVLVENQNAKDNELLH
ncbi:MAG: hypothetical protein ACFE89_03495 [Candidatus Hodarchaeota archaeon]